MAYKLNGTLLTYPESAGLDATAPSKHSISESQATIVDSLGGKIAIDPPTGIIRVHTWQFDKRSTKAWRALKTLIGASRLCYISTYDNERDNEDGDIVLEDVQCIVQIPDLSSLGNRQWLDSFSLVFTEMVGQ